MSVAQLTSMGFSQHDAEQTLQSHPTIEAAVEHLFSNAWQREKDLQLDTHCVGDPIEADEAAVEHLFGIAPQLKEGLHADTHHVGELTATEIVDPATEIVEPAPEIVDRAAEIVEPATEIVGPAMGFSDENAEEALPEADGSIEMACEHVSAAAPVEDDMPPATQTIGGDDAARWARWIPADAGTVDASSKRATPFDHAQVFLAQSMSSLRKHVSKGKQPEEDSMQDKSSSQNSVEEVATGSLVDLTEEGTQGAPDETHTYRHVATWHEMAQKVSASLISQSRMRQQALKQRRPAVETVTPESSTAAGVAAAATGSDGAEAETATVHDTSLGKASDIDAELLETIAPESRTATGAAAAATGGDGAEVETATVHVSSLEEEEEEEASEDEAELLDRAQVLWSQSVCALRSQVTGLLQHGKNSTQNSSQDAAAAAEECPSIPSMPRASHMPAQAAAGEEVITSHLMGDQPVADGESQSSPDQEEEAFAQAWAFGSGTAATATIETDGSAAPLAPGANVDAAPDGVSAAETDREQALENATRFDHAQVLLSLSMSALRSRVSGAANLVTVQ